MKTRILSLLCAAAILMSMVTIPAFADEAEGNLQDKVNDYTSGVITLSEDAENLTVEANTYIDLNGHTIAGVTVTDGATLYVSDTQTDDYTVADGICGAVSGITGSVQAAEGYLAITEDEAVSFHRVDLAIKSMSLRPGNAGVYYTSNFAADEIVAAQVESYGVALSVAAEPTAENLETLCGYSVLYDFGAGEKSGTLLTGIMSEDNTAEENAAYAAMDVYGRAYIKTSAGYTFGAVAVRDLQEQVEAIDAIFGALNETQKSGILAMYEAYKAAMADWNIPNLRGNQLGDTTITVPVKTENGVVTEETTVEENGMSITIPFGALVEAAQLTLNVTRKESSDSGIEAAADQTLMPFDVHVDGVSAENTVPLTVYLGKVMPENLNMGNYSIYHVEETGTNAMELVANDAEFTAHNQYKYTLDGELTLHMATFSEVAAVTENANVWNGDRDYSWYDAEKTELEIRNADQLAGFSAIVGGMAKTADPDKAANIEQDSFDSKTVKLLADINIGDLDSENGIVFYPIGYNSSDGSYKKTGVAVTTGFYSFMGTFDGNGNTISNFYHNTWEMKGDHNWYDATLQYYRDGMGLFGKVYGGTVKNLTVDNFSCDSEIGTAGVIAAYADCGATFENIAITNCNPRVYNIGNGGIVGCSGWYAKESAENKVTFRNITVDQTNKISALWDATGTSAGGILGQYYPTSGQSSVGYPENPGIHFENCHTAAIIEVNNDCCSNYHYYWYRYSGMLMGSVRANTKDSSGYTVADTTGITAENCTYTYGNWNEYWYCELVKNTIASYTHDHQFGRLTSITDLSEIQDESGNWDTEGNFALLDKDRNCVDCYHIFKNSEGNLYRHFHDVADETNPNIYETFDLNGDGELNDLKEDRQRYFIPFGQLLTGDGMGVKAHHEFEGVENTADKDGALVESEEKFDAIPAENAAITTGTTMSIAELFAVKDGAKVNEANIHVFVSPVGESSTVEATYACVTNGYMKDTFVTFQGKGAAKITITDYYFCTPTVLYVTVGEAQPVVKFAPVENVTVTSGNTKTLGELFTAVESVTIDSANVEVTGDGFTYTPNTTDWTQGTVTFNSGVKVPTEVTLTITDNDLCVESTVTVTVEPVPVQKFASIEAEVKAEQNYTLSELFSYVDNGIAVQDATVGVSGENITYNKADEWENATVVFNSVGTVTLTITDNYFCTATEVEIAVKPIDKFALVFENTDKYLYRVGNADKSTVALNLLFKAISDNISISGVEVDVANIAGNASGTYTSNAVWNNGYIQFSGTGVVKVTISAANANPLILNLEVVDAVNATSGISTVRMENNVTVKSNVVLLCDISSGFTVSEDYTFFGNGFTLKYTGDGRYLNNGLKQGIVTVSDNGTLDNLRIEASIYPRAYMYYGATLFGDYVQSGPKEVEGDRTRYYYQLSAVVAKGNATVSNCYIYGGRTNIFVDTGDITIQDTVLECGVVANVQIQSTDSHTVTLDDVTTIQYQVNPTVGENGNDTTKVMLGAGVIVGPDTETNPQIVLNGNFKQYNWVTADDAAVAGDEVAEKLINGALDATAFNHTVNGKTASNLGIIYMNEAAADVDNKTNLPYKLADISMEGVNGQAYSLQNATAEQIYSDYTNADRSTVNGDYIPELYFDLGDQELSYDGSEDTRYLYGDKNGVYALYQDGDDPITLDLTKLATVYKYTGVLCNVTASCVDSTGNAVAVVNGVVTLSVGGNYTLVFTATDKAFHNAQGKEIEKTVVRTYTVPVNLVVKAASIKNAEVNITKTALDGVYTTVNLTDYKLRINFLDAISVTDYDTAGTGTTVNLASNISSATLTPAGVNVFTTASTITITYTDGRILTVNISKISGSSPGTKTATVEASGYFITDGALNNKPTEASSKNVCTITSVSYKGNSGSTITNDTDVTVTWPLDTGSDGGGCVTPDTLITLADGTQVPVENLTGDELLLVWNLETGRYEAAPIVFVDSDAETEYEVIRLVFADGTDVEIIYEHGFFDVTTGEYVYIDAYNAADYIGHSFIKQGVIAENTWETVELVDVIIETKLTTAYSPVTFSQLCYYVDGMLSMPGGIEGLFNIFEVDVDTMSYNAEKMAADIETYGMFTYEDFAGMIPEEAFYAFNGAWLKVAIGKGMLTWEDIEYLANRYVPLM